MIARVGQDLRAAQTCWGIDLIEATGIRRFLEPLEFAEPLHTSRAIAQAHGYPDIIAPYSSLLAFGMPALWQAGAIAFSSAERNAQPPLAANIATLPHVSRKYSGLFATDMDFEFLRPARVGERLGRRGSKLLSCVPKETSVGRGAFIKYESEIITESGEVIARQIVGIYVYEPKAATA